MCLTNPLVINGGFGGCVLGGSCEKRKKRGLYQHVTQTSALYPCGFPPFPAIRFFLSDRLLLFDQLMRIGKYIAVRCGISRVHHSFDTKVFENPPKMAGRYPPFIMRGFIMTAKRKMA